MTDLIRPINWNRIEDPIDSQVWTTLTNNFWLDTKIAVSNDIPSWNTLSSEQKLLVRHVFVGLTTLDTVQSVVGAESLVPDSITPHEKAVYTNIAFMESVHAKSYSTIFATLCSSEENDEAFDWAVNNKYLQRKQEIVLSHYDGDSPLKRKAASTLLESFLFYSGFYTPLYFSTRAKLPNTADIVRLIIRDEAVHGYYIGYKFQQGYKKLNPDEQAELHAFVLTLMYELYQNEIQYTQDLYDSVGLTEDVKKFLKYNADKALQNLGFEAVFTPSEKNVDPAILAALAPSSENHDFFSGAGSSYSVARVEELDENDWEF